MKAPSFLRSIRVRLTLWYTSLLAITLIVFGLLTFLVVGQILREERVVLERETVQLDMRSASGQQLRIEVPVRSIQEHLRSMGCPEGVTRPDPRCGPLPSDIRDALRNRVEIQIGGEPAPDWMQQAEEGVADPEAQALRDAMMSDASRRQGQRIARTDALRVGFEGSTQDALLERLLRFLLLSIPAIILLSLLGGYALAHQALAPIGAITATAQRIRSGNLHERIRLGGPKDELVDLAETLNAMLAELEQLFVREKRFATDASHELQTPLAVIRTTAEVSLGDPAIDEEARQSFQTIVESVERMSRIVDDLLLLASYEQPPAKQKQVELRSLVGGILEHLSLLAAERGIDLSLAPGRPMQLTTAADRVERAAMNLIENALKYSERGTVTVEIGADRAWVWIAVHDTGPGIAPEHLDHLFERFYRVDTGRSRARGGNGLGLAIAHSAIVSLGGRIQVASTLGQGSTFTIRLPLVRPATQS